MNKVTAGYIYADLQEGHISWGIEFYHAAEVDACRAKVRALCQKSIRALRFINPNDKLYGDLNAAIAALEPKMKTTKNRKFYCDMCGKKIFMNANDKDLADGYLVICNECMPQSNVDKTQDELPAHNAKQA